MTASPALGSAAPIVSSPDEGLSEREALDRLARDGPNELPRERRRSIARIALEALREPMLQLLLAADLMYFLLGDLSEALVLLSFVLVTVSMVVVQEGRAERALAALKELASPTALVIRDGARRRIPARELVVGDLISISEGDRAPGDALLLQGSDLEADESLLTGESVPVTKRPGAAEPALPGGDDSPNVWSGSLIVRGSGLARVTATGPNTEIGRIGASLNLVESAPTPLQVQSRRLVRVLAAGGIGVSVLMTALYGTLRGDWIAAILAGLTLAMACLPEEFPVVLTVFLVMGARRLSRHRVLARRSAAIEALGAATLLCADKTGTLTENHMTVARLGAGPDSSPVPSRGPVRLEGALPRLAELAVLASRPDAFDPMERALHELGARIEAPGGSLQQGRKLLRAYPLEPELLAMSQAWSGPANDCLVAAKGAPEAIADLCGLGPEALAQVRDQVSSLARQGLRVLAVAEGRCSPDHLPDTQRGFDFDFVGLVALADPLRPGVREAVDSAHSAGIRVAMITGDHPATAQAIAAEAGIPSADVLTGPELATLDDDALRDRLRRTDVFARIMPQQKLRLVHAFVSEGDVVAMTGDGVNDAPSLKAAHIGVAMGGRGTDAAREAASLVLLDDDFTSLVAAVRQGRRIDDNIRKAFGFILGAHVPIVGLSLIPVLMGWPLLLGPVHIVFLELIIDPVCSIMFEGEPAEPAIMKRPPRDPDAPLFSRALILRGLLQGGIVLAAAMAALLLGSRVGGEQYGRSMGFLTLVLGNLGLVLANRSSGRGGLAAMFRPSPAASVIIGTALVSMTAAFTVPVLRTLFGFAPLGPSALAASLSLAAGAFAINASLTPWLGASARAHAPASAHA